MSAPLTIVFMGTPDFAVPSLQALLDGPDRVAAVVCQPDRARGRGRKVSPPPVKVVAERAGLPVLQPDSVRTFDFIKTLRAYAPDLLVVVAYGRILPEPLLRLAPLGAINVHGSLLPRHRGAAPIQWAIIDGETETGITTMMTAIGMDTGDILLVDRLIIDPDETAGELFERMALLGAQTLQKTIAALEAGTLTRIPQDDAQATKCPMLKKEHGKLDFSQTALANHNRVRGTNPWPGAYALLDGEPLKIHQTRLTDAPVGEDPIGLLKGNAKSGLFVRCADHWLEILVLQATGGKRLAAKDYLVGKTLEGKVLI